MFARADEPTALLLAYGDDSFRLHAAVRSFAERIGALERTEISPDRSPDEAALDRARVEGASVPLFGGRHLVVLRQPVRAAGRSTPALERLIALAAEAPPGAALAFLEERSSRDVGKPPAVLRSLVDAVAARGGVVVEHNAPRRRELGAWIRTHAEEIGVSIEGAAAALLAERIGGAVWEGDIERGEQTRLAHGELEKLATFAGARPITTGDVETLVADTRPSSIFAVTNAIERRERAAAAAAVERAVEEGQPVLLIMAALQTRISELIVMRDLLARNTPPSQIARRLGRQSISSADRLAQAARRYSGAELERMLRGLLEADLAIKTNALEPHTALTAWLGEYVLAHRTPRSER